MTPRPLFPPSRHVLLSLGSLAVLVLGGCGETPPPPLSEGPASPIVFVPAGAEPSVGSAVRTKNNDRPPSERSAQRTLRAVDLLAWIDPERDAIEGKWRKEDGALISPGTADALLVIPCTVPHEYRLKVVVERVAGNEMFGVGLSAGGRQFLASFESHYENRISNGLSLVNGQRIPENATTRLGRIFDKGKPTTIVATVKDGHVRVTADGEELVDYWGPLQKLSLAENWRVPGEGKLFLASWKCRYRITALELTALSGERPMLAVAPVEAPVPTATTPSEAGAGKTVTLADGTVLPVPTWEETYQAYEFRQPLWGDDWRHDEPGEPPRRAHQSDRHIETVYDARNPRFRDIARVNVGAGSIELDPERQILYWIETDDDGCWIKRLDLRNPHQHRTLVSGLAPLCRGLALDLQRGKIYWATAQGFKIQRADLNGSHVEDVIVGCDAAGGIVVDGGRGCFYYSLGGSGTGSLLLRVTVNRTHEVAIRRARPGRVPGVLTSRDLALDHRHGTLWFAQFRGGLCRVDLDGSQAARILDWQIGEPWGVAVDDEVGKLYWVDHTYGNLRRANLDGSMVEDLAFGLSAPADLALDSEHGYVYWTETYMWGIATYPRIRRMKIPPPPEPITKPAPARITSFSPARQVPGREVTLSGQHFKGTTKVVFIGAPTGERAEAEFRVESGHELSVTVPRLKDGWTEAAILVLGPGGLTVTLPTDLSIITQLTYFDLFEKGRPFVHWVKPSQGTTPLTFNDVSHSLVYVAPGGYVDSSLRGENTFLLKNGAVTHVGSAPRSVIYHEPFAIVNERDELPESSRLVAVPAIRPSFVEDLLQYQSRIRPRDDDTGE